jgi:Cys/Met metabolism PLP-dependent enzyme
MGWSQYAPAGAPDPTRHRRPNRRWGRASCELPHAAVGGPAGSSSPAPVPAYLTVSPNRPHPAAAGRRKFFGPSRAAGTSRDRRPWRSGCGLPQVRRRCRLLLGAVVCRRPADHERLVRRREVAGVTPGAFEAFLALRGARTLAVRLRQARETAGELAPRLAAHPAVARMRYPGLPDDHALTSQHDDGDHPGDEAGDLADRDQQTPSRHRCTPVVFPRSPALRRWTRLMCRTSKRTGASFGRGAARSGRPRELDHDRDG